MKTWNTKYENLKHEIWKFETMTIWNYELGEGDTAASCHIFCQREIFCPFICSSQKVLRAIFPCHISLPHFCAILSCHIFARGKYFALSSASSKKSFPLLAFFHLLLTRWTLFSRTSPDVYPFFQPFLDFCLGLKHVFGHNFYHFLDGSIGNEHSHGEWTVRKNGLELVSFKITSYQFSSGKTRRQIIICISQNTLSKKLQETSLEVILLPFSKHWCIIVIIILSSVKLIIFNHQSLGRLRRQILAKFHWSRFLSTLSHICISNIRFKCISPQISKMSVFTYMYLTCIYLIHVFQTFFLLCLSSRLTKQKKVWKHENYWRKGVDGTR